jgi:hypothetical protein
MMVQVLHSPSLFPPDLRVLGARESQLHFSHHLAERELSTFISTVKELLGSDQTQLWAVDWLDELELMDSQPGTTNRQWRAVTIAASARLANRLNAGPHDR